MSEEPDIYELHGPATHEATSGVWNTWGTLDSHVIGHLINPSFMGGPRWPALRQGHVISRRDDALLVASDGLADPMRWNDAEPSNGYEVEVYGIGERFGGDDTMGVAANWLGQLVMSLSNTVAQHGITFTRQLEHWGTLTVAFGGVAVPGSHEEKYVDGSGNVVAVLGLDDEKELPSTVDGPLSTIRLVNAKLLTVSEADFCVQSGTGQQEAREELGRRFAEQGGKIRSWLDREAVA
ncbi:hypothetical protein [Phytomonospora endophytica]|uniref:Uncharacterized protein n=1 Tax=Phytomonospora endophytica TaxID=714109 RepID=A0A841FU27_9ACTN|nr:hypothetical protein [Phytomonospora endophytica]MBB6038283.1 hypothetical protein [Phytomonospora endophytica]